MSSVCVKELTKLYESLFLNPKGKFSDKRNLGIIRAPVSFLEKIELVCSNEILISNLIEL